MHFASYQFRDMLPQIMANQEKANYVQISLFKRASVNLYGPLREFVTQYKSFVEVMQLFPWRDLLISDEFHEGEFGAFGCAKKPEANI